MMAPSKIYKIFQNQFPQSGVKLLELIPHDYPVLDVSHSNFKIITDSKTEVQVEISSMETWGNEVSSIISSLASFKGAPQDLLLTLTAGEVRDLPHNLTLEFLELLQSNTKMDSLGPSDVIYDHMTPDFMETHNFETLVIELKTHRRSYWLPGSETLLGEQWKYWQALVKKTVGNSSSLLGTIIFFRDRVWFPLNWPLESIKQATVCIQVAWSLQNFIYSNSSIETFPETEEDSMTLIIDQLSKVPYPVKEDPLHIDEDFCRQVSSPEAIDNARLGMLKILKRESELIKRLDTQNLIKYKEIKAMLQADITYVSDYEVSFKARIEANLLSLGEHPSKFKSVVQHPFASVLDTGWDVTNISGTYRLDEIGIEGKIWSSFILSNLGRQFDRQVDWLSIEQDIEHVYEARSQRFIQRINLSKSKKLELALKGVRGKKYSTHREKIEIEKNSQKGFPLDAYTHDIQNFINNAMKKDSPWMEASTSAEHLLRLIDQDLQSQEELFLVSGTRSELDNFASKLYQTKLFRALRVLEQIVSEVNYSRQTNLKEENTFIFKKIPGLDGLLAIVPSRADRHIFYSVLFPKTSVEIYENKPFKGLIDGGDFLYSEFVSLDQARISHLLGASSKLLTIFVQKLQTNFATPLTQLEIVKSWSEECALSLLIFLEDKAQTSTALLNIRYAYMDLFSTKEMVTHPLKILNKMPDILRSRLLVWILKNCISTFNELFKSKMIGKLGLKTGSQDLGTKLARDELYGFTSWVTQEPILKVGHLLDLSYLGHLHNKDEGDVMHGYLQIFSKITKEEFLLRNCRKEYLLGESDPVDHDDVRSHEFSISAVIMIGKFMKDKLVDEIAKRYPRETEGKDKLTWYLCKRLDRLKLEDLATTKASAWGLSADQQYDEEDEDNLNRRRVMSAIHGLFSSNELSEISVLKAALQALDIQHKRSNKGVLVNLFKKQQLGGPREIFVLTFIDRLLIYILETISRSICELMENEMLTKGDAKIIRSDEHMRKVHDLVERKGPYKITGTTSGDATTWCQRFTMRMFGAFLMNVLPQAFHPLVSHILNGITNKRLQLPHKLLQLWKKFPLEQGFDPYMNELKTQFLSPKGDHDLIDYNSRMLKNRSNFMQGILHYTSSAFHSAFLHTMSLLIKQDVERNNFNCVVTTKCSSDDSSIIITLVSADKRSLEKLGPSYLRRCLLFTNHFYWVFGAKSSVEKSTVSVLGLLEEFNSVWLVQNTVVMPLIKFVSSCFRTPPFSTFDEAQRQYASARTQVLSNGGSFALLKIIQEHQCLHYYHSLGLFNIKEGAYVFEKIAQTKTPFLGYFILEPSIMPGLLGFEMAYYLFLRLNERAAANHVKFYKNKFSDLNEALEFRSKITLGPGGLRKYTNFFKQLKTDRETIRDYFAQQPETLFMNWRSPEAVMRGIELKASYYQTAQVFSGVSDAISFNRSAYLLSSRVFTEKFWYEPGKASKHTWLFLMEKFNALQAPKVSLEDWRKDFILADFYDEILNAAIEEAQSQLIDCGERRKILSSRSLRSFEGPNLVPLSTCAAAKWFGIVPLYVRTQHELEMSWKIYKSEISWLSDDYSHSLDKSNLTSMIEMRNLLNAYEKKSKTMTVLCPMSLNVSTELFIRKAIRNNQWPRNKLKQVKQPGQKAQAFRFVDQLNPQEAISTVINVCTLPEGFVQDKETKRELSLRQALLQNLAKDAEMKVIYSKLNYLNRDSAECLRCLKFYDKIQNEGNLFKRQDALRECLRETGSIFTHYLIRQKRDALTGRWFGKLLFNLIIDGEVFSIHSENENLLCVKAKRVESALRVSHKLCKVLLDHGIKNCTHSRETKVNIHLLTGKVNRERTNLTLPLLIQHDLDIFIRLPRDPVVRFEVSEHTLKLVEGKTETTICMAKFSSMGGLRMPNKELLERSFEPVVLNDSLRKLFINYCLNNDPEPGWVQSMFKALMATTSGLALETRTWLKSVLLTRLEKKGFTKTRGIQMIMEAMEDAQDCEVHELNPELLCLPNLDMDDEEILEFLRRDLEDNPLEPDQSFFVEGVDKSDDWSVDSESLSDEALLAENFQYESRISKMHFEPKVVEEKSWMDSLFWCVAALDKTKIIKLFRGEMRENELTSDMKLLCQFLEIPIRTTLNREDTEIILS